MSVVNKPATEARMGVNPFTKEPMQFAAKPASKSVKASPLKVAKDFRLIRPSRAVKSENPPGEGGVPDGGEAWGKLHL